jgi:gluconokinase
MMASAPILWVVMGVSGSGKSTLALALAEAFAIAHADGDDFHSPKSVEKMQAGLALEDEDRWPWLDRIAEYLRAPDVRGVAARGRVVACSALKRAYRDRIRYAVPNVRFLFLNGDAALIRQRLSARQNHFMHPALLQSQLDTLELPYGDERDVIELNLKQSVPELIGAVATAFPDFRSPTVTASVPTE